MIKGGVLLILVWASAPQLAHAARRYPYLGVEEQEKGAGRQSLQTQRPFNIAHRGSNGEIPEETAEAYVVSFFRLLETFLKHCSCQLLRLGTFRCFFFGN